MLKLNQRLSPQAEFVHVTGYMALGQYSNIINKINVPVLIFSDL